MSALEEPATLGAHFSNASINPFPASPCCFNTPRRILASHRGETLHFPRVQRRSTSAPSIAVLWRCSLARLLVTVPREDSTRSTFSYSWKWGPPRDKTRVIQEERGSDSSVLLRLKETDRACG